MQLVKALCYKPEGHGFDFRWGHWIFQLTYSFQPHYFFLYFLWGWTKCTRYCGHFWPIVQAPDDRWGWLWSNWWNEDWQGKPKYSEKTCPSATLSTTNPTWTDPGLNPGRRGGKPVTNRLSYGTALQPHYGPEVKSACNRNEYQESSWG
jgi:hypothetical protein